MSDVGITGTGMSDADVSDVERRRALRRMKAVAGGLLVVAAVVYVIARGWERSDDAPAVAGYLRAAAEAGMVGGLADWFAVTALFRRPMGLPIPHTAIIPTRKDEVGRSLGAFVGENFLSAEVVRRRLTSADVARRLGTWLAHPRHADRVCSEVANVARAAIVLLRDDDVSSVVDRFLARQLTDLHLGPAFGELLQGVLDDRAQSGLVDVAAQNLHRWLRDNEQVVAGVIADQAPLWSPRFVDEKVALRVHRELVRISGDVAGDPQHEVRATVDRYLAGLADDLRADVPTQQRLDRFVAALVGRTEVRAALDDVIAAARRTLVELIGDPSSELRIRSHTLVMDWGRRLATGDRAAAKVDAWIAQVAVHVVSTYREELTRLITDTVDSWDATETSRRVEIQVGRDLQFIRVNGTLVGALVGVAIHATSQLLP